MTKPLDVALSSEIARHVNSKATGCFDNAYQAALLIKGAVYVQGFLTYAGGPDGPIEYSWIELEDCLVDPTFPHLNKSAQELHYFAAQRLSLKQVQAAVEEAREDYPEDPPLPVYGEPPYEYYGDIMLGGRDYQDAYQAAETRCRELNQLQT